MNRDIRRAYRVLGLAPGASSAEVKAAYRDLAQVWHPDRFSHSERLQDKAQRNLKRINEAFQALKDRDPAADAKEASVFSSTMSAVLDMGDIMQTRSINRERVRTRRVRRRASGTGSGSARKEGRPKVVGLEEWERTGVLKTKPERRWSGRTVAALVVGAVLVTVVAIIAVLAVRRILLGP